MDLSPLVEFCQVHGLELSSSKLGLFEKYGERLYEMNRSINLTRVPYEECALRHFVDSLLISEFVQDRSSLLDVGTGVGFPSWVLACVRPGLQVTALDSSGKMLKILREFALPNLTVHEGRAEDAQFRESFDFVTGRAVAPLSIQLEVSAPWARVGGLAVPFRTPAEEDVVRGFDCAKLGLSLESVEKRTLPGTDVVRLFPMFRKTEPTLAHFPRTWAQIKKTPL